MDPLGKPVNSAENVPLSKCLAIVWEARTASSAGSIESFAQPGVGSMAIVDLDRFAADAPSIVRFVRRFVAPGFHALSRPTFSQLHRGSPLETTRIAATSVSEAADVIGGSIDVEWGCGREAGRLHLDKFHAAPTELGRPWVADAVLHGHGIRCIPVSIALFDYGNERCGIQIRPRYRRPWSTRRLRRCLQSTHNAADRLRDLAVAVDFTPPHRTAPVVVGT